jgi:hypothetical protein
LIQVIPSFEKALAMSFLRLFRRVLKFGRTVKNSKAKIIGSVLEFYELESVLKDEFSVLRFLEERLGAPDSLFLGAECNPIDPSVECFPG